MESGRAPWTFGSGPVVARTFHRLLALIFLDAWLSLWSQEKVLIGERGLLPIARAVTSLRAAGTSWWDFPTLAWWWSSDRALTITLGAGVVLALVALAGVRARACLALTTALYLSHVVACRTFCFFQWDNLLLECGILCIFLSPQRRAPWGHLALRLLLFKLYWESGIAKWQSPIHDWQDGSAMTFYYETAPLPTALAFYAHHLPLWWHHFESWATLAFELVVPLAIFGPRLARRFAFVVFTGFQIVNAATANYGFFCYLATALHVFLLDDEDLTRAWTHLRNLLTIFRKPLDNQPSPSPQPQPHRARTAMAIAAVSLYAVLSTIEALHGFAPSVAEDIDFLDGARARWLPFRLVNNYHLFAAITRERIEPDVEAQSDGTWRSLAFRHKSGPLARRPDFVAPHQPRVDFQLWFYGLGYRRGAPAYVTSLLDHVCHDPEAVQPLFADALPPHATAVRLKFWRYQFTSAQEKAASGDWWKRNLLDETEPVECTKDFRSSDDDE